MTQRYRSAAAFKQALEQRIRNSSTSGVDFARRRQLIVFDRFLARVALEFDESATLKGGLALELRLQRARTTRDVDLRVIGSPDNILDRLRTAAGRKLGDFMVFNVRPDSRHPEFLGEGMQYNGVRFRAECTLAGKVYGVPFGVDVGFGDPMTGRADLIQAENTLGFANIPPPSIRVYPTATHVAEKLHAYTVPRERPNSRVKDLPDLALLGTVGPLSGRDLRAALDQTFAFRGTHSVPVRLPEPPATWESPYASIVKEGALRWETLDNVFEAASAFLNPVLAGTAKENWNPENWSWSAASL